MFLNIHFYLWWYDGTGYGCLEDIHHEQIRNHKDQSDTEQQQPERHASCDHRAVLGPFFMDHGERFGYFP